MVSWLVNRLACVFFAKGEREREGGGGGEKEGLGNGEREGWRDRVVERGWGWEASLASVNARGLIYFWPNPDCASPSRQKHFVVVVGCLLA